MGGSRLSQVMLCCVRERASERARERERERERELCVRAHYLCMLRVRACIYVSVHPPIYLSIHTHTQDTTQTHTIQMQVGRGA